MDELKEVAAFDAWCVLSNPFHHTTDDGTSNRRDWEVWQARAALTSEVDRLKKVIKQTLDALAKFNYEESAVGGWAGYENGHGQEVGTELDAAIATMTQEIKP